MSCELSQERDVGITEYMTADLPAFTAILKHRFRDFQVNEVDLQGQEAVLTSLDPPRLPQPLPLRDLTDEAIQSASRSFAALAGAENGNRLTALLHWVKTKHGPKAPQQEPQWVVMDKHGVAYVDLEPLPDRDTRTVALGSLAQGLYLPRWASPWGYAGSKDKRGVTQQWVTGFKIDPHQLAGLRHSHWCRNIRVGNFSYVAEPIELGQLAGNRFNILLRAVRALGFVNYFGLQRFGTAGVPTYR
ncbi:tRNA pseudouridine synthase D [Haematococcus lacustris]|uniref:tRNA pseudouridine synthase D n=1 Tax=Haematococcus lacustris TaxID=44745 RepID=A0A699Y7J4_HAELA|nr:tRNA pseudouridine synthase D [Haematococcus lacustris]